MQSKNWGVCCIAVALTPLTDTQKSFQLHPTQGGVWVFMENMHECVSLLLLPPLSRSSDTEQVVWPEAVEQPPPLMPSKLKCSKTKFIQTPLITKAWSVCVNEQILSGGIYGYLIYHLNPTCLWHLIQNEFSPLVGSKGWVLSIPSRFNTARNREC